MITHPILNKDSGVFVDICANLPSSFAGLSYQIIQKAGLVPYVYKGLHAIPLSNTSNIHIEASHDLQKCKMLLLVLDSEEPFITNGTECVVEYLSWIDKYNVVTRCYLVASSDKKSLAARNQEIGNFPKLIPTKIVSSVEEFSGLLNSELRELLIDR